MNRSILTIAFLLVTIGETAFPAGTISPRLRDALDAALPAQKQVTALVVLDRQVDIPVLDRSLYSPRASMEQRAYTVITSLQDLAYGTQGPILSFLQTQSPGEVTRYRSFWVINMLLVEASPSVIEEIALREDVALLDLDAELILERPVSQDPAPESSPNGSEPGIRAINAHLMWALGFTGNGRIVMNIDTGVNGNHPALNYKWRGTHVPASQAWFDPVNGTTFPNDCDGHGTHTCGTMNGLDPATNDTIGVAPGAEWIASNSLCSGGSHTSNSIASFEWAMDPDGNPGTIDDMPDAIGNSWFDPSATDCANGIYRPVFDAVEAAGIAIVFSAGNNGPGPSTITVPKNTNTDLVNVFAIGAVDGNNPNYPIASFSSRGPSTCGGQGSLLIKPETSAPGVNVRSSYNSGYTLLSGTSMACPHVVGAIALLREAFPQFTGHELKMALYNTARDLGPSGEDNDYGMGIIDVHAAFLSLGVPNPPASFAAYSDYTTPTSIELAWEDPTNLANGDTLNVGYYTLYIMRDGDVIDSLEGGVGQYTDEGLTEGQEYVYEMYTILDSSGLASRVVSATWTAGGSAVPMTPGGFSLSGDQDQVTVRWTNPGTNSDGTPMIDYGGVNLYQDGELAATFSRTTADTGAVDSAVFSPSVPGPYSWYLTALDTDVPVHESEPTETLVTPLNIPLLDAFSNAGTPNPAVWTSFNADVNTRSNNPPSTPLALNMNGMPAGGDTLTLRPLDLSGYQGSGVVLAYYYQPQGNGNAPEAGDSLRLQFRNDNGGWIQVRGYAGRTLQPFQQEVIDLATAPNGGGSYFHSQFQLRFVNRGSAGTLPNDDWFIDNVFFGVPAPAISASADTVHFDSTLVGSTSTAELMVFNTGLEDLIVSDVVVSDPSVFSVDTTEFTVAPGEGIMVTVTFAPAQPEFYAGTIEILSNDPHNGTLVAGLAGVGTALTSIEVDGGLPREFAVHPNYPNPFNPATTIKYELPVAGNVELVVYDMLGSRVRTLVSGLKEAGYHQVQWDGANEAGIPVTTGVYLYRFSSGDYSRVRKMMLLK